jgi:hypothetical protein
MRSQHSALKVKEPATASRANHGFDCAHACGVGQSVRAVGRGIHGVRGIDCSCCFCCLLVGLNAVVWVLSVGYVVCVVVYIAGLIFFEQA